MVLGGAFIFIGNNLRVYRYIQYLIYYIIEISEVGLSIVGVFGSNIRLPSEKFGEYLLYDETNEGNS